jgi:hypothetical protein
MQDYDRTSKWLIQHHGDSILRIAGVRDLVSWRPLQAELVQPRQLPDGLVEAQLAGQPEPDLYVLELATYPDQRVLEQVLRDMTLVYLDRRVLPEVLVLVLRPKGNVPADDSQELQSPQGWTRWRVNWKVIKLWTIPAEDLLATGDLGVIPWVPLSQISGPPEPVIQQCRERIDRLSLSEERENLLAVTQVLTGLRYNEPGLLTILGGQDAMIESPLIQEIVAKVKRKGILTNLQERFGSVSPETVSALQAVENDAALEELMKWSVHCPDIESFRERISS